MWPPVLVFVPPRAISWRRAWLGQTGIFFCKITNAVTTPCLKRNIISNLKFVLAVLTDVYHYFSVVMAPTAICYLLS